MVMNLTEPLAESRKWLHRSLSYDQDQDVNTFETTIRMLGGLLGAHYLSTRLPGMSSRRDSVYLAKTVDLAERLLSAYESRSGIPYANVHLARKVGIPSHDGVYSSMAEAATVQLEKKYLSHLTGDERYWRKAEKVMQVLGNNAMEAGLLPIFVDPESGVFVTREIRLGSRGRFLLRIPHQAVPANLPRRAHIPRDVGRSPARHPDPPHQHNPQVRRQNRGRTAPRHRWLTLPQDGPPRLLPARLHRPGRNRRLHPRRSPDQPGLDSREGEADGPRP
ncbi:hypothetical protein VTI74DRAFT_11514 [Chaetomium olivicolor]